MTNQISIYLVASYALTHVGASSLRYSLKFDNKALVDKIRQTAKDIVEYDNVDDVILKFQEIIDEANNWKNLHYDKDFKSTMISKIRLLRSFVDMLVFAKSKKILLASTFRSYIKDVYWFHSLLNRYKYDSTGYVIVVSS